MSPRLVTQSNFADPHTRVLKKAGCPCDSPPIFLRFSFKVPQPHTSEMYFSRLCFPSAMPTIGSSRPSYSSVTYPS